MPDPEWVQSLTAQLPELRLTLREAQIEMRHVATKIVAMREIIKGIEDLPNEHA